MSKVVLDMAMSLDGFIAGLDDEYVGLHDWFFSPTGRSREVVAESIRTTGAIIMGRRMYEIGAAQNGFVDNPYQAPHLVLIHDSPTRMAKGAEAFTFITSGIESALKQAQAVVGDKKVVVGGRANIAQQYLKAGLIDEIQIHLVSALLGEGIRLFEQISTEQVDLESTRVIESSGVTDLRFHIVKKREMIKRFIGKTTEINALASKVWRVFTDPDLIRQMGDEYVSDWKVGSSLAFKGLDGKILTNGTILNIKPEKLLQHKLFNLVEAIDSVVTYELQEDDGSTTLHNREEFTNPVSDKEYVDAVEGWNVALLAVKELAENI